MELLKTVFPDIALWMSTTVLVEVAVTASMREHQRLCNGSSLLPCRCHTCLL